MTTAASKLRSGLLVEALSEMPGSKAHDIDAYCHGWLSSIAAAFVEESEVSRAFAKSTVERLIKLGGAQ